MSWRVLITPTCDPDLEALSPADRAAVLEDLAAWTGEGPPRSPLRSFAGPILFEDPLPCGLHVAYMISDAEQYIALVRIRKTSP